MPLRRRARVVAILRRPENLFFGLSAANHRMEAADSVPSAAFSTTRRRPSSLFGVPRLCVRTNSPSDDIGGCTPAALKNVVDKIRNRRRPNDAESSTNGEGLSVGCLRYIKRLHRGSTSR